MPAGGEPLNDLEQFLQDRAMEHDTPSLLFHQAAEFLVSAHVVRPGGVTLMEMVATARPGAGALTWERVGHLLTGRCAVTWTGCWSRMRGMGWPG